MVTREALEAWARWLRASGRPETTIGLRRYHVARVFRETGADPWSVTAEDLVMYLSGQRWAPETRRAYRASLRSFYAWGQATGRRVDSPAQLLPPVKVPRGMPRPVSEKVLSAAVAAADQRVRLMVQLAAVCGLRRGEVAQARRDDVVEDLVGYSLRVRGKGGHVRHVPLPEGLAVQLRGMPAGWLFPSPRGGHLTPHHVGKLVSALLPEGWTMHSLRHRCGTVAYAGTRDLRAVQELLGHAKPETTAIYTQVPAEAVRQAVRAAERGPAPAA